MANKILFIDFLRTLKSTAKYDFLEGRKKNKALKLHGNNKEVSSLLKNGFVVINNYLDAEKCDLYRSQISKLLAGNPENKGTINKDSIDISLNVGTTIQIRQSNDGTTNYDTGMIDIRNVDNAVDELKKIRHDKSVLEIVRLASNEPSIQSGNFNSYVNRGIVNTRCFHIDSLGIPQFKAFIYLTDVVDESYGPYSFVSNTHTYSLNKYANIILNYVKGAPITDMRIFSKERVRKFTAPKGTLIIANQNGFHRGTPQEKDKERIVLVNNFFFDSSAATMM